MDGLPKLIPVWQDVNLQSVLQHRVPGISQLDKLPDYGGAGVDVLFCGNELQCEELKYTQPQVNFKSNTCSLPFLPPNEVTSLRDPCLENLKVEKEKAQKFCASAVAIRNHMRRRQKYKHTIMRAHKEVEKLCKQKNFKDVILPKTIINLSQEVPERLSIPSANFDYVSGCMKACKFLDGYMLLHPSGKYFQNLTLTPLRETREQYKTFCPNIDEQKVIDKLPKRIISQLVSESAGICYVCQGKSYSYIDFSNVNDAPIVKTFEVKKNIANISASPYIPSEVAVIMNKGKLKIIDVAVDGYQANTGKLSADRKKHLWWSCSFGSHPRSVLYMNNEEMSCLDLRNEDQKPLKLFSIAHPSCFKDEQLTVMKRLNYFQHLLASSSHLFICDERYPEIPVMQWDHMLADLPLYCDIATYKSFPTSTESVVILGTQKSSNIAAFFLQSSSQVQPVSLSPPMHLSMPSDCLNSLRFHGIRIKEEITQRILMPLTGISSLRHSSSVGFTVFQITSLGDVFYQDFEQTSEVRKEKTHRVDTGGVLTPPKEILPLFADWEKGLEVEDRYESSCFISSEYYDFMKEMFSNVKEVSESCPFCLKSDSIEIVSSDICPSCGLHTDISNQIQSAFEKLSILAGPTTASAEDSDVCNFDVSKFQQFKDPLSKNILMPWSSEDLQLEDERCDQDDPMDFSQSQPLTPLSYTSASPSPSVTSLRAATPQGSSHVSQSLVDNEFEDDYVPPSQDIPPITGETLRMPRLRLLKKRTPTAGF